MEFTVVRTVNVLINAVNYTHYHPQFHGHYTETDTSNYNQRAVAFHPPILVSVLPFSISLSVFISLLLVSLKYRYASLNDGDTF